MRIAPKQRVIYENNPLVEVIWQVRFNRVLSLERESPALFQDQFASKLYPRLEIEELHPAIAVKIGADGKAVLGEVPTPTSRIFHFHSMDGVWKLSLCADFISLTCTSYRDWGEFQERFTEAFATFSQIYPSTVVSRLGLRYKDVIEREPLGLSNIAWKELLAPFVIGIFGAEGLVTDPDVLESDVEQTVSQSLFKLDDCRGQLRTAYLKSVSGNQYAFLVDSDFYIEYDSNPPALGEALSNFENLHKNAGALFQHCITERLHNALGPK